jgi:Flp pilus assembly protein TadB
VPAELALLADLVAAGLDAGAPLATALAVADLAVPAPRRHSLATLRDALERGLLPPDQAEHPLTGAAELPEAFVRVVRRSSRSGARLAEQLRALADDLREEAAHQALERARRVGVLAVLPLGLCCLPAFVLLTVVPLAAGLLGDVLP